MSREKVVATAGDRLFQYAISRYLRAWKPWVHVSQTQASQCVAATAPILHLSLLKVLGSGRELRNHHKSHHFAILFIAA
jgi:hypothetical protein